MRPLTLELFQQATSSTRERAELFYAPVMAAMERFVIDGLYPTSGFLATCTIESQYLQKTEESLYYKDPKRIVELYLRIFDKDKDRRADPEEIEQAKSFVRNHEGLSKLLYSGYHGRGLIQLTWLANYLAASEALGVDYVGQPDLVKEPTHAALTAAWFYSKAGCIAVSSSIERVTKLVNPAMMHIAERTAQYNRCIEVLA